MVPVVEYYLCAFYNRFAGGSVEQVEDMPPCARRVLSLYTHEELIRPFVYDDLKMGEMSVIQLARKYDTTPGRIRAIGRTFGFYKKHLSST